jgi:adenosylcobinamide-phosphate guanylyltransferase
MGVTALIMAGGKGSRMDLFIEKPLIELDGKPIITYVLDSLKKAKNIDRIIVAISSNTPKTAQLLSRLDISTIKTPGKEYVYDMAYAIRKLTLQTVLVIGSDIPLITSEIIDLVVEKYNTIKKSALSVVVPLTTRTKLGLSRAYEYNLEGEEVVPAGINIIDGNKIDNEELDEEIFLLDKKEVALNINTKADLKIAQKLIKINQNAEKAVDFNV